MFNYINGDIFQISDKFFKMKKTLMKKNQMKKLIVKNKYLFSTSKF